MVLLRHLSGAGNWPSLSKAQPGYSKKASAVFYPGRKSGTRAAPSRPELVTKSLPVVIEKVRKTMGKAENRRGSF